MYFSVCLFDDNGVGYSTNRIIITPFVKTTFMSTFISIFLILVIICCVCYWWAPFSLSLSYLAAWCIAYLLITMTGKICQRRPPLCSTSVPIRSGVSLQITLKRQCSILIEKEASLMPILVLDMVDMVNDPVNSTRMSVYSVRSGMRNWCVGGYKNNKNAVYCFNCNGVIGKPDL